VPFIDEQAARNFARALMTHPDGRVL